MKDNLISLEVFLQHCEVPTATKEDLKKMLELKIDGATIENNIEYRDGEIYLSSTELINFREKYDIYKEWVNKNIDNNGRIISDEYIDRDYGVIGNEEEKQPKIDNDRDYEDILEEDEDETPFYNHETDGEENSATNSTENNSFSSSPFNDESNDYNNYGDDDLVYDEEGAKTKQQEAQRAAEDAKIRAQQEAQRAAEDARAQQDTQRIAEEARIKAQQDAQRATEDARAQQDAQRIAEEARIKAQQEVQRAAEDAKIRAQQEAQRVAEETKTQQDAQKAAENARAQQDAQRIAEEARTKAQQDAQRVAEEARTKAQKTKSEQDAKKNADEARASAERKRAQKAKQDAENLREQEFENNEKKNTNNYRQYKNDGESYSSNSSKIGSSPKEHRNYSGNSNSNYNEYKAPKAIGSGEDLGQNGQAKRTSINLDDFYSSTLDKKTISLNVTETLGHGSANMARSIAQESNTVQAYYKTKDVIAITSGLVNPGYSANKIALESTFAGFNTKPDFKELQESIVKSGVIKDKFEADKYNANILRSSLHSLEDDSAFKRYMGQELGISDLNSLKEDDLMNLLEDKDLSRATKQAYELMLSNIRGNMGSGGGLTALENELIKKNIVPKNFKFDFTDASQIDTLFGCGKNAGVLGECAKRIGAKNVSGMSAKSLKDLLKDDSLSDAVRQYYQLMLDAKNSKIREIKKNVDRSRTRFNTMLTLSGRIIKDSDLYKGYSTAKSASKGVYGALKANYRVQKKVLSLLRSDKAVNVYKRIGIDKTKAGKKIANANSKLIEKTNLLKGKKLDRANAIANAKAEMKKKAKEKLLKTRLGKVLGKFKERKIYKVLGAPFRFFAKFNIVKRKVMKWAAILGGALIVLLFIIGAMEMMASSSMGTLISFFDNITTSSSKKVSVAQNALNALEEKDNGFANNIDTYTSSSAHGVSSATSKAGVKLNNIINLKDGSTYGIHKWGDELQDGILVSIPFQQTNNKEILCTAYAAMEIPDKSDFELYKKICCNIWDKTHFLNISIKGKGNKALTNATVTPYLCKDKDCLTEYKYYCNDSDYYKYYNSKDPSRNGIVYGDSKENSKGNRTGIAKYKGKLISYSKDGCVNHGDRIGYPPDGCDLKHCTMEKIYETDKDGNIKLDKDKNKIVKAVKYTCTGHCEGHTALICHGHIKVEAKQEVDTLYMPMSDKEDHAYNPDFIKHSKTAVNEYKSKLKTPFAFNKSQKQWIDTLYDQDWEKEYNVVVEDSFNMDMGLGGANVVNKNYDPNELKVPVMYQGNYGNEDLEESGCGITAFTMAYSYYRGIDYSPLNVMKYAKSKGYWNATVGLYPSNFFADANVHYDKGNFNLVVKKVTSADKAFTALSKGHVILCGQTKGIFTAGEHWIALTGITNSQRITVNDPNGYNMENGNSAYGIGPFKTYRFTKKQIMASAVSYYEVYKK